MVNFSCGKTTIESLNGTVIEFQSTNALKKALEKVVDKAYNTLINHYGANCTVKVQAIGLGSKNILATTTVNL